MKRAGNTRLFAATSFFVLLVLTSMWAPLYALLALQRDGKSPPPGKLGAGRAEWSVTPPAPAGPALAARFGAQGNLTRAYFPAAAGLDGDLEQRARMLLDREIPRMGLSAEPQQLVLVETRWSPSGPHLRFQEMAEGIPVWGGEAVVSFDRRFDPIILAADLEALPLPPAPPERVSAQLALERAETELQVRSRIHGSTSTQRYRRRFEAGWLLAWQVRFACHEPLGDWEVWIDADSGAILEVRDRTLFHALVEAIDGHGQVFVPDPVFASGDPELQDLDDSDAAVPDSTYRVVALRELDAPVAGLYTLSGPNVRLEDWEDPRGALATSPTPDFFFTRSMQGFEEVMVYYHIDTIQRWFQALGFTDANNRQQVVDAHGFRGLDNSKYVPSLRKLSFGEGGVDDAEDAAVIIHEYGHATQHDIVPTWGAGGHTAAMGEGFGDYLANSYIYASYPERVRAWNGIFQWDGHNEFWPGRPAIDPLLRYPEDAQGAVHYAGTLWCSALTDALYALDDRKVMDRLVLDHHYALTGAASMEDAANAIIVSDLVLHEGQHVQLLHEVFERWGFLDASTQSAIRLEHTPLDIASLADGIPKVKVRIASNREAVDPTAVHLHVRPHEGSFVATPMHAQTDDLFSASLPIPPAPDLELEYYIEVGDSSGTVSRLPLGGPQSTYRFSMGLVAERFETETGWRVGSPQDDAVRGTWVRAAPVGTPAQPGSDHTHAGSHCFVTGNASPGMPMSEADVDEGQTSLYSPQYDLSGAATVLLSYWRWFSNDQGSNPGEDAWRVEASGDAGVTWIELENTTESDARWRQMRFDLTAVFGVLDRLQLRFVVSDRGENSIVEAAVDDLTLLVGLTTDVDQPSPRAPIPFSNEPNPFNPNTTVRFELDREVMVRLDVYDARGALVRRLLRETRQAGPQRVLWDGRDQRGAPLASGTYFLRLHTPDGTSTRRATLLR